MALFRAGRLQNVYFYPKWDSTTVIDFLDAHEVDAAIFSTVTEYDPEAIAILRQRLPYFLKFDHSSELPIKIGYATPETLRLDRIAAVVGAVMQCPDKAVLIVDAGTCVTYDLLTAGQLQSSKGQFNNRLKIALGAEVRPKNMGGNYFEHVNYRAGIFYNRSYLKINGNDMDEIGATCGFGFPLATDKSVVNVSFEYINRQCTPIKLITEDHFRISVSLTFNEMWFWQRKFE